MTSQPEDGALVSDSRMRIDAETGDIELRDVRVRDEGQYLCMAQNSAGRAFSTLTLKVHSMYVVQSQRF